MDKDFTKFMNEQKYAELKEERLIEILKNEHQSLKEKFDVVPKGVYARRDTRVSCLFR